MFPVDDDRETTRAKKSIRFILDFNGVVGLTPAKTSNDLNGEFDPGSELTLAECITHASRAKLVAIQV